MILSKVVKMAAGRLEQMPPEAPKNNMQVVFTSTCPQPSFTLPRTRSFPFSNFS
ncbi:hypothetical protein JHK86_025891 [Glycine max]|nr:hypothetical protein JHK86_025891 [Glycine max]